MGRGLDGFFCSTGVQPVRGIQASLPAVFKARRGLSSIPVAMAWGKHLFPFRTEQLSPTAPMVLGSQGPGRVGRRRFTLMKGRPPGRPSVVALTRSLEGSSSP